MSETEAYITCRVICYDCDPADVARRMVKSPDDPAWYSMPGGGEFEIVDAELDEVSGG